MKYNSLHRKKGVAGLNVLLSIISMLFMIGILIMVFVIGGVRLQEAVKTTGTSGTTLEGNVNLSVAGTALTACTNALDGTSASASNVTNATGFQITSGNYSISVCTISNVTSQFVDTFVNVTYTYRLTTNAVASNVINATYTSLDDTVDWFPTFIVLGAMVVLILLVVIIINSIRGSGITKEGA